MSDQNTKQYVVVCAQCNNKYFRSLRRINEAKKHKWKSFCSPKCLSRSREKGRWLICAKVGCGNTFYRRLPDIKKNIKCFCCRSHAATVNNAVRLPKPKKLIQCRMCQKYLKCGKVFCSPQCKSLGSQVSSQEILTWIKEFCRLNGRIPLKRECAHYYAARNRFGTWNNAIKIAGFEPNPVMFAKKYLANDGHKCDSLSERIIDDWLSRRNINHQRSVPYLNNEQFTADFVVDKYWIEFFGLSGELKRYDYLKRKKLRLAKKLDLNLIKLYPADLFPKGNLDKKLSFLTRV